MGSGRSAVSLWTVSLIDTLTGVVGHRVDATGTWADGPLNDIPSISASIAKESLTRVRVDSGDLHPTLGALWERGIFPWRDGLLVCFDGKPLVAGPLTAMPVEEDETVSVSAGGIEALLNEWIVLYDNYSDGTTLASAPNVRLTAKNLSWLAWVYVKQSMLRNGNLPIVAGMPDGAGSSHYRNFEPFNLENNGLWKRLTEITGVINGPDLAFRPEWVPGSEGSRIRWRMMAGSTASPYIAQSHTPFIDLMAPIAPISGFKASIGWNPATIVYGHGAGEGAGMIISIAQAPDGLRSRLPALESVYNESDQEDVDLLQRHTEADMASRINPTVQLTIDVDTQHPSFGLSHWWTGDVATVTTGERWMLVKPGTRDWRCVNRHGDIGGAVFTVELQED